MLSKLTLILLVLTLFALNTFANSEPEDLAEKKGFFTLLAITNSQETVQFLKNFPNSDLREQIDVPVNQFNTLIAKSSTELRKIIQDPDLSRRLKSFVVGNGLVQTMVGYQHLKTSESLYVNILILMELQRMIAERNDLQIFGRETIINFNTAINETISSFRALIEKNLSNISYSKNIADKMRQNFVRKGLEYKINLSPADQWLNELNGKDRNYVQVYSPNEVIQKLIKNSDFQIYRSLRTKQASVCAALFAI